MIGKRKGEAVMLVIMGVMVLGGIILWLARGEFHMMPMHGHDGSRNANVDEDAGAEARRANGSDGDVSAPADDREEIDDKDHPDTISPSGPSSRARKH